MLFCVTAALLATWTAAVRFVASAFSRLNSRLIAFNEGFNPIVLRRRLERASSLAAIWHGEFARLRKASRLGTRVVGCLSENEIHQHYVRMMSVTPDPLGEAYLRKLEDARKPGNSPLHLVDGKIICKPK